MAHPDKQNREKMECPSCGYKCFPQWMNDKANCLKCQAVLKARPGAHGGAASAPRGGAVASQSPGKSIADIFKKFDKNGDGVIQRDELREVLLRLPNAAASVGIDEAHIDQILKAADVNGDGVINFEEFSEWVLHPGDGAEVMTKMKAAAVVRQNTRPTSTGAGVVRGPERFFYDKSSYTGAHRSGGPSTKGAGGSGQNVSDLSEMTRGNLRGQGESTFVASNTNGPGQRPASAPRGQRPGSAKGTGHSASPRPYVTAQKPDQDSHKSAPKASSRPGSAAAAGRQIVGPERFFYDKSSYTGTHAKGGPEAVAKGAGTAADSSWKRPG